MLLSDVCLSRTSGLSREQRGLGRPKLAEVAHVTRDSDTTSKVNRSRSPGRFTHRGLKAWGRCSGDRENVLGVGNYCYVVSARRRARRCGAHGGGGARACRVATRTFCYQCWNYRLGCGDISQHWSMLPRHWSGWMNLSP